MPKAVNDFSAASILKLQEEIKKKSGNPFKTLKDCKVFAEHLTNDCRIIISEHTIARIFNVISSTSAPSKYTLDRLSEYCGSLDWSHFQKEQNDEFSHANDSISNPNKNSTLENESEMLLLKLCLEDHCFTPALKYLKELSKKLIDDFTPENWKLVETVGVYIKKDLIARQKFFPEFVKDEMLRKTFFNYWVDIDELNTYYADIVKNNFTKHNSKYDKDFKIKDIWAHTIELYSALYCWDIKTFVKIAYKLFKKYNLSDLGYNSYTHYYPTTRFRACLIIYKYITEPNTPTEWFENQIFDVKNCIKDLPYGYQSFIVPLIIEALFICGKTELIFYFHKEYKNILKENLNDDNFIHYEAYSTQKLIYYFHLAAAFIPDPRTNLRDDIFIFPNGNQTKIFHDSYYSNNFMNNVVQSLYPENRNNREHLLSDAIKIANRLNHKLFVNQVDLIK